MLEQMLSSGGDDSGSRFPGLEWGDADRVRQMCFLGAGRVPLGSTLFSTSVIRAMLP